MQTPPDSDLPSSSSLRSLTPAQSAALAGILKLAISVDASITREELAVLREEFGMLPGIDPDSAVVMKTQKEFFEEGSNFDAVDFEKSYHEQLKPHVAALNDEDSQMAAVRLLAVVFASDGIEETEVDFFNQVVDMMNFDDQVATEVLRAAWSTRQERLKADAAR